MKVWFQINEAIRQHNIPQLSGAPGTGKRFVSFIYGFNCHAQENLCFSFFHLDGFSSALQLISLLRKKPTRGRPGHPSGQVLLHDPSQPELLNDGDDPLSPRGVREQPVGLHGKHQSAHQIGHVRHFQSLSGRLEEPLLEKWSGFFLGGGEEVT